MERILLIGSQRFCVNLAIIHDVSKLPREVSE